MRGNPFKAFSKNESREVKILLMYPYALFSRDRMEVESHSILTHPFNEYNCGATYSTQQAHWIPDRLSTILKLLLDKYIFSAKDIRLSVLNPLCSTLICDKKAFLTPYHYGRRIEETECTANNSPVIVIEEADGPFDALVDHVNYLWTHSTAYPLEDCIDLLNEMEHLRVKKPDELLFPETIRPTEDSWKDMGLIAEQIAKIYCPDETLKLRRKVFFCHPGKRLKEVQDLKSLLEREFYAEGCALMDEHHIGDMLFKTLEERTRQCSHAIVLAARDNKTNSKYPNPNVLHELGWCQALLGAKRVLILLFPNTLLPTNISGVIYDNYKGEVGDLNKVRIWLEKNRFQRR
jgi:hypothetical protein